MSIKIGIVGTNFISDRLIDAVSVVPGIEAAAVFSRTQRKGEDFADRHGIEKSQVYTEYESFLESGIDAVYIATPIYAHKYQAIRAMEHGKHVLCEKIMAVNAGEVQEMIECAAKNQVVLLEAMRPAFDPGFTKVKELLPKIGRIRRVTMEYCQYSSRYDKFKQGEVLNAFNPELSNGAIMDIGVYSIYLIAMLFGEPKKVKAFSTTLSNGFEGDGIVLMQYEDLIAEAIYSKIVESENPSIIVGEEGSILIDHLGNPKSIELRMRDGRTSYYLAENDWAQSTDSMEGISDNKTLEAADAGHTKLIGNMQYEVRIFTEMAAGREKENPYLEYSLHTVKIIDEARAQNGIVFPADLLYNEE